MTLEEAKDILSFVYTEYADKSAECACKYNDFETANYFDDRCKAIETVLKALEDTIPKEKVRKKIEELKRIEPRDDEYNYDLQNEVGFKLDILNELLGKE